MKVALSVGQNSLNFLLLCDPAVLLVIKKAAKEVQKALLHRLFDPLVLRVFFLKKTLNFAYFLMQIFSF